MYSLFITRGYPTNKYKMQGIFEMDQAKALVKNNQKVVYIALDSRSIRNKRKWGFKKLMVDGVNVYSLNVPLGGLPRPLLIQISEYLLNSIYKKVVKDHGVPQVIHAHFPEYAYLASKLKDKTNLPLIVTEHTSKIVSVKPDDYLFKLANIAYSKADEVIAVSKTLSDIIEKKFSIKSTVIPNMLDIEVFNYKEKQSSDNFNFISVGNLIKNKGMDKIIEAFNNKFKSKDKVFLHIFGGGPEHENLKSLIIKYNLRSKVILHGLSDRKDIADTLSKSDCFVLPSKGETFGVAYIEALAAGLPVIATKCGGPEDFVDKTNGLLISIDDQKELETAMLYMYNNIDQYNREKISSEITNQYSPVNVSNKIVKVYKKVL